MCADAADSGIAVRTLFYTEQAAQRYASYLERWSPGPRVRICWRRMWRNCWRRPRRRRGFSVSVKSALGRWGWRAFAPRTPLGGREFAGPRQFGGGPAHGEGIGAFRRAAGGNCCDVYSPKVLRASMGAVFRLPFRSVERLADAAPTLRQIGFALYAAVPDRTAKRVTEFSFEKPSIIAVGNEGNGLEAETVARAAKR
ncbi:MAG: TrmH family RNA methyltransferase [Anaeromassilibacillus sp.]